VSRLSSGIKEWLAIAVSFLALTISAAGLYNASLRVTDDVRVVAAGTPLALPDYQKKQFEIRKYHGRFIFINSGTRSAAITAISLWFSQPNDVSKPDNLGCSLPSATLINYDMEPFILRPNDMIAKDVGFLPRKSNDLMDIQVGSHSIEDGSAIIPFTDANDLSEKVKYKICVDIAVSTPSVEYAVKTVEEFEDVLGRDVVGYTFFAPDVIPERRPVQLIKSSSILFFD